tara:strand:+ start:718 stop:1278 length:561 start_codon:yes stop_codon:yes gene_type:complete
MVNVTCSANQDRRTTTSETHPHIPPPKTKFCYLSQGENKFDRDKCGQPDDGACHEKGGAPACIPDDYGGYCNHETKQWVSSGSSYTWLTRGNLMERYKSDGTDTDSKVNRALREQERNMTNKIRQLQIMGNDPLSTNHVSNNTKTEGNNNEVHEFVSDMLINIGIGSAFVLFFISLAVIAIQNKLI